MNLREALLALRRLENRLVGSVVDPRRNDIARQRAAPWSTSRLDGTNYCLLTTYRRDGTAISVPVWFATDDDRVLIRSGAADGKVKRIRHTAAVRVAPCSRRGRPLGPPMEGHARLLRGQESSLAEELLERRYGAARRVYNLTRAPLLPMEFIAVAAAPVAG